MRLQLWIYIVTIAITIECSHSHRTKRRIAFPKGSSFFATGFKVAWPLPDSSRTQRSIGNILDDINLLYESHGFNGPSCIIKNVCEALNYIKQKDGVLKNGIIMLVCLSLGMILLADERVLSRQKRYLIFPQGSNVQLVYCLTIGAFAGNGDLVLGLTAALAWELPSKVDTKISKLLHRKSRSLFTGLDGKSCVMRALCETARREENQVGNGTFIQELFYIIFKLRDNGELFEKFEHREYDFAYQTKKSCAEEYTTCPYSIYQLNF
ncbi:hypothetical protein PV326_012340 [Microctonus aethiopoides]|nr:hypothetical protein PV326_012340 [Microctonus aethiopoides]